MDSPPRPWKRRNSWPDIGQGTIRLRWLRRGIDFGVGSLGIFGLVLLGKHEQFIFVPGHLALLHPERIKFYFVLGAFIRIAAPLGIRTAHRKFSALNGDHRILR